MSSDRRKRELEADAGHADKAPLTLDLKFETFGLSLIVQMLHTERKTAVLQVTALDKTGYLAFKDGEIVDAQFADRTGHHAAITIINLPEGQVRLCREATGNTITITAPFRDLLEDAAKYKTAGQPQQPTAIDNSRPPATKLSAIPMPALSNFSGAVWSGIICRENARVIAHSSPSILDELTALSPYFSKFLYVYQSSTDAFGIRQPAVLQITGKFGYFLLREYYPADHFLVIKIQRNANVEDIVGSLQKIRPGKTV
ncbi:MAG: DUF4388 domain-containing protein [Desulfocapsaceae bacterium]|nr:DUF4388 domain-containing protein [Desulfocapsaceae bacterium]